MTRWVLRDDDVNATTDPERVARAYAPLLDAGLPISFATIPEVALDVRAPDGTREAFLDERWPDVRAHARLVWESPLAAWLRRHDGAVDVLQHGYTHERVAGGTELGALDAPSAAKRLDAGARILERALGRAASGFVAPWDRLSRGSLEAVIARHRFLSTSWVSRDMLPVRAWPAHVFERARRSMVLRHAGGVIVRHGGGILMPSTPPDEVADRLRTASRRAEIAVVMLHHWMFWGADEPHPVIRALARALRGERVVRARDFD